MMKIKDFMKKFGSKSNIKIFTILTVVIFIILTSLIEVGLDPKNLNLFTWFSNTILSTAISIAGLLLGESIANDSLKQKENGLYQRSLIAYISILQAINSIKMYFNDFLLWFKEKETFCKQVDYLTSFDIREAKDIIKYLSIEDVDKLLTQPISLSNGVIVRRKSEEQINAIKKVLEGKINVKTSMGSYYLNVNENHSSKSILEEGKRIDKRINDYLKVSRTSKIIVSICVSLLFATITFNEIQDTPLIVSITKLTLRLCTFVSCLFCGWQTEAEVVKEQSKKIENKTDVLTIFKTSYDSGEFKPSIYEDLAREEYENYIKDLEKEGVANGK